MSQYQLSSITREHFSNLGVEYFKRRIFDFVPSSQLLDHQLGVSAKFNARSAEGESSLEPEISPGIFSNIISRFSQILISAFNSDSIGSTNIYSESGRARIPS
jgi:hypothetical protein